MRGLEIDARYKGATGRIEGVLRRLGVVLSRADRWVEFQSDRE